MFNDNYNLSYFCQDLYEHFDNYTTESSDFMNIIFHAIKWRLDSNTVFY